MKKKKSLGTFHGAVELGFFGFSFLAFLYFSHPSNAKLSNSSATAAKETFGIPSGTGNLGELQWRLL